MRSPRRGRPCWPLSEARQRAILETALDAVISIDRDARVTYVNSAFERTFGYRAERDDRPATWRTRSCRRRCARRTGAGFARYLETGQAVILDRRIEMPAMRADGTEFPAEVAVTRAGLPGCTRRSPRTCATSPTASGPSRS